MAVASGYFFNINLSRATGHVTHEQEFTFIDAEIDDSGRSVTYYINIECDAIDDGSVSVSKYIYRKAIRNDGEDLHLFFAKDILGYTFYYFE